MNTYQRTSCCRIISIASAGSTSEARTVVLSALIRGQRTMDLAELARSIAADPNLYNRVTKAASQEFGWTWVSLEQAIVLLGRQGLSALLFSMPARPGRSASRLHHPVYANHTSAAGPGLLGNPQEESI
jgi:hypothetical protein